MNIYEKNLVALEKRYPDLVQLVESITIDKEKVKVLATESGVHRLLYKNDDGEEIFIHKPEDIAACTNNAIALLGKMEKVGIAVLCGFGLGYFAEEVLKRFGKGHVLVIYEAMPVIFRTALETRDISALLESDKVNIVVGDYADNFTALRGHHHLVVDAKFCIVKHHSSVRLNGEAYKKFLEMFEEEKLQIKTDVNTILATGKEFINSFMLNIPSILRNQGVNRLKDMFKGRPVIIVSAGPSLDKNLHLLKKAKGKAVIIAIDAALPTILPCNIIPDIIVAVDPIEHNFEMFNDNPLLKEIPFVCLAHYTPGIVKIYPGPLCFTTDTQNVAYKWLAYFWDDKGNIETSGGSVANLAFSVAEFIGSDTIAFVGQDLSFRDNNIVHTRAYTDIWTRSMEVFRGRICKMVSASGRETSLKDVIKDVFDKYYPPYLPADDRHRVESFFREALNDLPFEKRVNCEEVVLQASKKNEEKVSSVNAIPDAIEIENIFGEKVFTRHDFQVFKLSFEKKIKKFKGKVINASEDGAPIEGAVPMRLVDFIDEYCADLSSIDALSIFRNIEDDNVRYDIEGLLAEITTRKNEYSDIIKTASKVLKYVENAKRLKGKGKGNSTVFHDIVKKMEALTTKLNNPVLNLIMVYHYKLQLYLNTQEAFEIDDIKDNSGKYDKLFTRAGKYYPELIDAIDLFLKQLEILIIAIKREETIDTILTDCSLSKYEKYFKVGKIYKSAGMVTAAVRCLEMAMDAYRNRETGKQENGETEGRRDWEGVKLESGEHEGNNGFQLVSIKVTLAEVYLRQFRLYEAKVMLESVVGSGGASFDQVEGKLSCRNGDQLVAVGKQEVKDKRNKISKLLEICDEKIAVWEERTKEMGKFLKEAEANYGGHYESGNFYFKVKNYEKAEKAYQKAVNSQQCSVISDQTLTQMPNDQCANDEKKLIESYYGLVNTYLAMDEVDNAVDTIEKLIELEPKNPYPYCDIGRIAAQNNNIDAAEGFFRKAISLAPDTEEFYKLLAGLYVNLGQAEKAIALYEQAVLVYPNSPAFVQTLAGLNETVISNISQGKQINDKSIESRVHFLALLNIFWQDINNRAGMNVKIVSEISDK